MAALLDPLFGTDDPAGHFSDRARLQGLLDFEAGLARAEAATGLVPRSAVDAIAAACHAAPYDLAALAAAARAAGNLAIPAVKALTERVAATNAEAARWVHYGATSQDAQDSGLVLQLRAWLAALEPRLAALAELLAGLAERERATPLAGRTWLQQALPVTFGLKAAGWLDALQRHRTRLAELQPRLLVLQFGGGAGTLAALGDRGLAVAEALAATLGIGLPALPWHAARDRIAELACWLGLLVGTLGKIARDLSLLMQSEVGEAFEPGAPGRGGSSTMPQKRNPVGCAVVLAAAQEAPQLVAALLAAQVQEQERGLGGWHLEWTALPRLCLVAEGALGRLAEVLAGLELDRARMRANLELAQGTLYAEAATMALAPALGRPAAHRLVADLSRRALAEQRPLPALLAAEPAVTAVLDADRLEALFRPEGYLGAADAFIDRVLRTHRR